MSGKLPPVLTYEDLDSTNAEAVRLAGWSLREARQLVGLGYRGKLWVEVMLIKGLNDSEEALKESESGLEGALRQCHVRPRWTGVRCCSCDL